MILILRPKASRQRSLLCWKGKELSSVGSGLGQGLGPGEHLEHRSRWDKAPGFKGSPEVAGRLGQSCCALLNDMRLLCCCFLV